MGKYIRKSKPKGGGVALMEVSHTQASLGVRTRAKVALERLQKSGTATEATAEGGGSYLQLRSRRLEKISPIGGEGRRQRNNQKDSNSQGKGQGQTNEKQQGGRGSSRLKVKGAEEKKEEKEKASLGQKMTEEVNLPGNEDEENKKDNQSGTADTPVEEASFGENVPEFEGRGRTTRESTPCSLIRDPDNIRTPGSSTRPAITSEGNNRENSLRRHFPTANEMDEFFTRVEEEQQRKFIEKYNFDPVNEKPLPGRFQWEKLKP